MSTAPQLPLFSSPHLASRWRVTGPRNAFRIYEVAAVDAETGEFSMRLVRDSRDERDPERVEVGYMFDVHPDWFRVRGQVAAGVVGSVRPHG